MSDNQNIINLEDGWNNEIKCKAIEPLEVSLPKITDCLSEYILPFVFVRSNHSLSDLVVSSCQTMLDEGFQGKTKLFSNREYVNIYT